jgi:hypothetical protein
LSVGATPSYYHYIDSVSSLQKELKECITEVEQIQEAGRVTNNGSKKKHWLTIKEEEEQELEQKQEMPTTTLDGYFIHNNATMK